jgi:hypothetical protein
MMAFHGWGRLFAFWIPSHETVELFRAYGLVNHVTQTPSRFMLWAASAPCVLLLVMRGDLARRRFIVAWAAIGATEVLPTLLSYFKAFSWWNNLTIIDLWVAMPVVAVLATITHDARDAHTDVARAFAGGAFVILLIALLPMRAMPTSKQYDFGRALDAVVAEHHAKGERVLVSVGASTLVHAGALDVPLDRAETIAELSVTGGSTFEATRARLAAKSYGAIVILGWESPGYPAPVQSVIDANYVEEPMLAGDGAPTIDSDRRGVMNMMSTGARVLVPR